jgi:4-aminobutyrate aminotransferase
MIHNKKKELHLVVADSDKNAPYLAIDDEFVNPVLARCARIVAEKAKGSYIYDMNGDAYLDFASGIAVTSIGHCHPRVVEAVQKQVAELMHTSVVTHNKTYIETAQKLADLAPGNLSSVFLANSGAEALEGAIKMARYVTGRPAIINFMGSFHGRTLLAVAMTTSKLYYRERYEPLPGSIYTSKYPYVYRSQFRDDPQACLNDCIEHLEFIFHQLVHPEQVAAIVVEPIQGEGGYVVPPTGFLKRLREVADHYGILLIFDEVQTGFARTGRMFACEHEGVVPDIMFVAKAIASGLPLSAFISRRDITEHWQPGRHGSTFGGNPVACAAALATMAVLEDEKLPQRAEKLGKEIKDRLTKFAKKIKHIGEVRGRGLMIGIEFDDAKGGPSKEIADAIVQKCLEKKLLVITCGTSGQVIRLMPPLTLSDSEAEKACEILEQCMTM